MLEDYHEFALHLRARISATVPDFKGVHGLAEWSQVAEASESVPNCYVLPGDEAFGGTGADHGLVQLVLQRFDIIITVESAKDIVSGDDHRSQSGVLKSKLFKALAEWKPLPAPFKNLRRLPSQTPDYIETFAYFPVRYEIGVINY